MNEREGALVVVKFFSRKQSEKFIIRILLIVYTTFERLYIYININIYIIIMIKTMMHKISLTATHLKSIMLDNE